MSIFDDRRVSRLQGTQVNPMHETPDMQDGEHTGRAGGGGSGVRFASDNPQYSHNDHTRLFGPSAEVVLVRNLRVMLDSAAAVGITKADMAEGVEALIGAYEDKTGKVD